jgi:hypothetical protein
MKASKSKRAIIIFHAKVVKLKLGEKDGGDSQLTKLMEEYARKKYVDYKLNMFVSKSLEYIALSGKGNSMKRCYSS